MMVDASRVSTFANDQCLFINLGSVSWEERIFPTLTRTKFSVKQFSYSLSKKTIKL